MRYRIGEFARLGGTSIKTLRFYDALKLLEPAEVDSRTRYRYYSAEQLQQLAAIRSLKDLGASLDDIRRIAGRAPTCDERRRLLEKLHARALRSLSETHRSLRWIELALDDVREDDITSVVIKQRSATRVASIRAGLRNYAEISAVESSLRNAVDSLGARGTRGVLWHRCEASGAIDGEPFVEIDRQIPSSRGYELKELPPVTVASTYCAADDDAAIRAYEAIERWIHRHGYRLDGPKRELYVGQILEIQFPVKSS